MRTINREIVVAMIVSKDGKIFFGMKHPDKGGVYIDFWHLPGGGVEKNESKKQALVREVMEETGIDILPYEAVLIDDTGEGESEKTLEENGERVLCKMKFYVYKIEINDKEASEVRIVLSDELEKYAWFNISEARSKKLTPPSVELFERLGYC